MNLKSLQKIIFTIVITITSLQGFAAHTKGGWIYYEYLGSAGNNSANYKIVLKLYTECTLNSGQIDNPAPITIFNNDGSFSQVSNNSVPVLTDVQIRNCSFAGCYPCINNPPSICYRIFTYELNVTLPITANGYIISYQRCCRIGGIENLVNSGALGGTWTVTIPGSAVAAGAEMNNSAKFNQNDTAIICKNNYFTFDFSATDADGDKLTYKFVDAYTGGSQGAPTPNPSANPGTFGFVNYASGYSGAFPLGNQVSINPTTGIVSGIAPSVPGIYVVCAMVTEVKNNIVIATVRKELHIQVADCNAAEAELTFNNITCDGFTQTFVNAAGNPGGLITSYYWDFGVQGILSDTSNSPNPTFTFPDTGVYQIKLVVNRGQACSDSVVRSLGIYPGFFPNFTTSGVCYQSPIQFNDASTTQYGVVDSWRWDFGDAAVLSDTSRLKNPTYQYPSPGTKSVQFIVTNSKGCIDTLVKDIVVIDKPTITLPFRDTLICSIDTLQLQSTFSSGSASWLPNYRIINPNSNNPLVYPLVTTTYYVTANDQGCIQKDSIKVNVKDFVTVDVMPDTAICLTDAFKIRTNSDALSYVWTPATGLSSTTVKEPITTPISSPIKYYVNANIGKCQSRDSISIIASPYPQVYAGLDTSICYGDQAQLHGTASGANFNWSPVNTLINSNTLQPISNTLTTTTYILTTQGAPGCPKPARDTVVVRVIPKIIAFAGNDTSIVVGQPLQLNATGATNYLWTPSSFLSNATIANPIATLTNHQTYIVKVSTVEGCFAYDTINITVFKTAPDIFVPTVFTPNADGTNDRLIPVPVGITKYDYFEVYNRWGQKLYRTTQVGIGWDGTFGGKQQNVDTYVWQVLGTDYTGKKVFRKGTVVLVR